MLIGMYSNATYVDPDRWCHSHDVSYSHPVDDPSHFTYCSVPEKGFDALAFMAIALLIAATQQGKLSALLVFTIGCALQVLAFAVNLGPIGNGINLWLGIAPAELFLYGFLPPLLLDSAVHIEWFTFRKVMAKVMTMAFLVVLATTALMVPLLLYGFGLASTWNWVQAALFVAIIASTDAVTVNALVKAGGGPEEVTVLLEGESLFNDASSVVLFTIFFNLVEEAQSTGTTGPLLPTLLLVGKQVAALAAGGALVGYIAGYITRKLLVWMQRRGCKPAQELTIIFAMAYAAFYVGQSTLEVSGVIAVVVLGLYGSAQGKWELSNKAEHTGVFEGFVATLSYGINGIVFFYAGASSVNFVWRSVDVLFGRGLGYNLAVMAGIYVAMFALRYLCIAFFNIPFSLLGVGLPNNVMAFATIGGLRGALSLIMAQVVIQAKARENEGSDTPLQIDIVTAQMVLWSAGFVVLTLLVNAPLMPWFMSITGLTQVSNAGKLVRDKARRSLLRFTKATILDLKEDSENYLRGVDWSHVEQYTDLSSELQDFINAGEDHHAAQVQDMDAPKVSLASRILSVVSHPSFIQRHRNGSASHHSGEIRQTLLQTTDEEEGLQRDIVKELDDDDLEDGKDEVFSREGPLFRTGTLLGAAKEEPEPDELLRTIAQLDTPSDQGAIASHPTSQASTQQNASAPSNLTLTEGVGVLLPVTDGKDKHLCTLFFASSQCAAEVGSNGTPLVPVLAQNVPSDTATRMVSGTQLQRMPLSRNTSDDIEAEARMRLASGFKRFLHHKRADGLLSARGLRLLDYALDQAIDECHLPLNAWQQVEKEVVGSRWVQMLSLSHMAVRRMHGPLSRNDWLKLTGIPTLLSMLSGYLSQKLSSKMLLACETAMSYFLALSFTPFVHWLTEAANTETAGLAKELKAEAARVWQFMVDREIEAPERFTAVQSYRAAMAVMHQQAGFVSDLYMSGMIDEAEKEMMIEPIEQRIGDLERAGPIWRAPRTREILTALPFLANLPSNVIDEVLSYGSIKSYATGEVILTPLHVAANSGGMYVVINGMVKGYVKRGGQVAEFFLGTGRVFGLMSCLTGDGLPGSAGIVAAGNQLGKGPVLFHIPTHKVKELLQRAHNGDPDFQQLELDLYRVAALHSLERLKAALLSATTKAIKHLLATQAQTGVELTDRSLVRKNTRKVFVEEERGGLGRQPLSEGVPATQALAEEPRARQLAIDVLQSFRDEIATSRLLQLSAGSSLPFTGHVMLVKGTMTTTAAVLPTSNLDATTPTSVSPSHEIRFQGPTCIPHLLTPDVQAQLRVAVTEPLQLKGATECLLLLCDSKMAMSAGNQGDAQPGLMSNVSSFTQDFLNAAVGGAQSLRTYSRRVEPLTAAASSTYAPETWQTNIVLPA